MPYPVLFRYPFIKTEKESWIEFNFGHGLNKSLLKLGMGSLLNSLLNSTSTFLHYPEKEWGSSCTLEFGQRFCLCTVVRGTCNTTAGQMERPCLPSPAVRKTVQHHSENNTHLPTPSACTSSAPSQPLLTGGSSRAQSWCMERESASNLWLHDCATCGFEHPFGPSELKSFNFLLRASCQDQPLLVLVSLMVFCYQILHSQQEIGFINKVLLTLDPLTCLS